MNNEYIEECIKLGLPLDGNFDSFLFSNFDKFRALYEGRRRLCAKYSWAIPNDEAISECVVRSPLVEMGAGTGYWARLIKEAGGDIVAYDMQPVRYLNYYHRTVEFTPTFFNVKKGLPTQLRKYKGRTLLLCWPPYNDYMAFESILHYKGDTLIFIGEEYGCTGDSLFFDILRRNWKCVKHVRIPTWEGIHDMLYVYKRVIKTNYRLEKKKINKNRKELIKKHKKLLGSHMRWSAVAVNKCFMSLWCSHV